MTRIAARRAHLGQMLRERRREMQDQVRSRVRGGATQGGDDVDRVDAHSQGDLELALLQMRAETLTRIDAALVRLDAGKYGSCAECAKEITEGRLRALPFAVRCQTCEERREEAYGQVQRLAQRRGSPSLFSDVASS